MHPTFRLAAIAVAAATVSLGAAAQEFPGSKNVTIVVPFSAGGPTDRVARDLAEALRKPLGGATVVIENVAGAGSSIGAAKVARSAPDGYTLLLNHIGMSTMPSLYRKLPFNVLNDFEFLGIVNDVPMTLIGRPSLEAKNFSELRTWINKEKEKVNIGHSGLGSAGHLCGLMFQSALNVQMTAVPYKGAAPAITDLMGNTIDLMCDQTTNTTSQIEAQKVKAYGVTTLQKLKTPALKDLETLDSAGLKGFNVTIWHGLYAPKGTPAPIIRKLSQAIHEAQQLPEVRDRFNAQGNTLRIESPEQFKRTVHQDRLKWAKVVKDAKISID